MPEWKSGDCYVFECSDLPGVSLTLGKPVGENRPAIGMHIKGKGMKVLGRFNSDAAIEIVYEFLAAYTEQINKVIDYYETLNDPHQGENDDQPAG